MADTSFLPNKTWQIMHQTVPPMTSARFYTPRNVRDDGTPDPQNGWLASTRCVRSLASRRR